MNILIVDDERIIVEALKRGLRNRGHQVLTASSGDEALKLLNNGHPVDLVLTDYAMEGMNGMELLKSIREENIFLPVILMTAYGEKDLVIDALRHRCNSFIEKPFTIDQVMREIEAVEKYTVKMEKTVCRPFIKDELRRENDSQRVVNAFLRLSLEEMPLDGILNQAIDLLISISWLAFESKGGIFLAEDHSDGLKLVAKRRLPEMIQKKCDRVRFGQCLCGKAAMHRKLIFTDCIDERHDITHKGMSSHGYYCVPILLRGKLLGVIVLYLKEGHRRDKKEEEFLSAVANTLAGIIQRKKMEADREKIRAQLVHAQKMEAVGTLAGGIAHDFNNLIQVIGGFVQLLLLDKSKNSPEYEELIEIENATQRASDLTRQLLTFSRKVKSRPRPLNLNREIRQAQKLLLRALPKMIKIELRLNDALKTVNADPSEINQILMNLAVNARDALAIADEGVNLCATHRQAADTPDWGRLIIRTENVTLDEKYCRTHVGARPGMYVQLTVTDTGHGMDPETLKHIFEPFYTTKDVGQGTGLGLAMVYGIVKSYRGYITCHSEVGVGTSLNIYLPVIDSVVESAVIDEEDTVMGGHELILFIDDDESLRTMGKEILTRFGYRVVAASNGVEALEIIRKTQRKGDGAEQGKPRPAPDTRPDAPDLVILDRNMPEMGGDRCLEEILRIDPQAKVLMASGYVIEGQEKEVMAAGARGFVSKPYSINQMLRVVREVLDT